MNSRIRTYITTGGGLLLAALLLYLALRGVDLEMMMDALRAASYGWLLPLALIILLSVWLRAWRWLLLLRAHPHHKREHEEAREGLQRAAFFSVMIGYMVNYAAPRAGEVARAVNLSAQSRYSVSGIFGTVFSERLLDVIVLAFALLSSVLLLLGRLEDLSALLGSPAHLQPDRLPWLLIAGGLALTLAFGIFLLRYVKRLKPILRSFWDGIQTLWKTPERAGLLLSTVGLWMCYVLMAYIPFLMLDMVEPYSLTLLDTWVIMALGALGILVPSPGGAGSYHYITIQTLVILYGVSSPAAAGYAIIGHGVQLVFFVAAGAICLAIQGIPLRDLLARQEKTSRPKK